MRKITCLLIVVLALMSVAADTDVDLVNYPEFINVSCGTLNILWNNPTWVFNDIRDAHISIYDANKIEVFSVNISVAYVSDTAYYWMWHWNYVPGSYTVEGYVNTSYKERLMINSGIPVTCNPVFLPMTIRCFPCIGDPVTLP